MYWSDVKNAVTVFPGFVTSAWASACVSITVAGPAAYNATATKAAVLKDQMRPSTAAGLVRCAGTASNKHKYTGGAAGVWYPMMSIAKATAYTAAQKVSGGTMTINSSGTASKLRFWFDAYSSGGVRQASVGPVTVTDAAGSGVLHAVAGVMPTASSVTVPVGGYLVARIDAIGATARLFCGAVGAGGPAGVTQTFSWNPTELPAGGINNSVENRERFHDSTGTPLPDGTKVYEYDAASMAYTGVVATIGGPAAGPGATDTAVLTSAVGVGEATFARAKGDVAEYFYVVPDPASGVVWTTGTAYALDARINPASVATLIARATTAGTSGATEPVWPTAKGATILDGSITWTMESVETICTNAVKGYQLGVWPAATTVSSAPSDRIAPAGTGQYALCTTGGTTGATEPVWPTTIVSGTTTVTDGTAVWTMYEDEVYV